eukprot:8513520-Ditylum_brightwellii.AAC.1
MAKDPSSDGVITGGYNFYIGGTLLPRFYKPVTLVWPVPNQRTKLVGVILETMFCGDYVFRVGGEIIPRHKEREHLTWPIFCDILALVPCH